MTQVLVQPDPSASRRSEEVVVWRLQLPHELPDHLAAVLSEEEQQRAAAFHDRRHAVEFAATRAMTRLLLASYVDAEPASIEFRKGRDGRPEIAETAGRNPRLAFNVSHAWPVALCGIASRSSVGVDVEGVLHREPDELLVRRTMSPAEREVLADLAGAERGRAFIRFWTRKEAVLKAHGGGLRLSLPSVDVRVAGPVELADRLYWVCDLDVSEDHLGAVACPGDAFVPVVQDWSD